MQPPERRREGSPVEATQHNFPSCTNSSSQQFGQVSLATTTTTIKEEYEPIRDENSIHDCMIETTLLSIQSRKASINNLLLLFNIVCQLLINEKI